jgi:hypothetical protein
MLIQKRPSGAVFYDSNDIEQWHPHPARPALAHHRKAEIPGWRTDGQIPPENKQCFFANETTYHLRFN